MFCFSKSEDKRKTPKTSSSAYEFFWGVGCPHCKIVEDFLANWDKTNKVTINKKEIYQNRENAVTFSAKATACGIPQNQQGVPMLVTPDGKCLLGDTPIIDYLKGLDL